MLDQLLRSKMWPLLKIISKDKERQLLFAMMLEARARPAARSEPAPPPRPSLTSPHPTPSQVAVIEYMKKAHSTYVCDQKTASTGLVEDKEEQNVYAALALLVDEKEMED